MSEVGFEPTPTYVDQKALSHCDYGRTMYYLEQKYIGKIIIRLSIRQMTRKPWFDLWDSLYVSCEQQ